MMLHVRDCPGTTSTLDVCPFPWCRKVKHLMYHLVACPRPRDCAICSPIALSRNLKAVIGLTNHRWTMQRERAKAAMVAAAKAPAPKAAHVTKNAKPATYRPPVKKTTTLPGKLCKPVVATKPVTSVPQRVAPAVRTGATVVAGKAPSIVKPTNGVVVKSLIKPAGRSVVVLKSRPLHPASAGATKPVGAALSVSKPTVSSLPGVPDPPASNTDTVPSLPTLVPIPLKIEGKTRSTDAPSLETGNDNAETAAAAQPQSFLEATQTDGDRKSTRLNSSHVD